MEEYKQLVAEYYPQLAGDQENNVNLVGSWETTMGGDLDQVVHMWEYRGYVGYEATMARVH